MIAAALLLLQISAAVPSAITVRATGQPTRVSVTSGARGSFVSSAALMRALGGSATTSLGRTVITVGDATIQLQDGLPFARRDTSIAPMIGAPYTEGNETLLPLHFVTELLPRLGTGVFYDVAARELRTFTTTVAKREPAMRSPSGPTRPETTAAPGLSADDGIAAPRATRRTTPRKVVVDAGHGGPDGGMSGPIGGGGGPRIQEKQITLAVSRYLAEALRNAGIEVVLTRTTDTLIALSDRGRIANRARADLFISVHVNAAPTTWRDPAAGSGFETYFLAEAKTEEARRVEQMENESVKFETGAYAPKGDPLSFIINDMAQNEHLRESNDLAQSIQDGLARIHPGPSRGVKQANFAVLRTSFMPAVLVEIGFGTNPSEAAFMAASANQRQIAAAIASGALEYLNHYEQRIGGGGAARDD